MKKIIKILFFVFIIIVICLICIFYFINTGISNSISNEIKSKNFSGIVTGIDTTSPCFISIQIKQKETITSIDVQYCCGSTFAPFFRFIEVGDSIEKEKENFELSIIKANDHEKKTFAYPYCIQ